MVRPPGNTVFVFGARIKQIGETVHQVGTSSGTVQDWYQDPVNDLWHVPGYSTAEFRHESAAIKFVSDISSAFGSGPCAVLVRSLCIPCAVLVRLL
jgi:hypothetical protein